MSKLRRKCCQCGKVKTAKYRWGSANSNSCSCAWAGDGDTYFCSNECALKRFSGVSVTKCSRCEKPLYEGKDVYVKSEVVYGFSTKVYCSVECYLADRNCLPIEVE